VKRVGFRGRLFLILLAFALIPSILISLAWSVTGSFVLPLVPTNTAWDSVTATGKRAITAARAAPLTNAQRRAFDVHEETLRESVVRSLQSGFLFRQAAKRLVLATLLAVLIFAVIASRVAGHLSRNLSRPLQELVGWTAQIGRGERLPTTPPRRGAPEFEILRSRMRDMADELELGRARALEAERAATLRESARQVAHELKNPLTPIRFAVARLLRDAPPELEETVEVLAVESARLEAMAQSFAQFGRLPEGPRAEIDVGELARYTARATIPPELAGTVDVAGDVPMIHGHYDALARALSNVILNAVDACKGKGRVDVRVRCIEERGHAKVEIAVSDTGCGIARERLARIWDPYVTSKPGGTGLGLAIARQTVLVHDGSVWADSTVGAGTEIRFVLPANGRPGETHAD
ncbi:MAG TPA: HAMP domain-containing sensor histidine kinase, partial [Gemmatimonadaceae bacterium]|nr:HAMP domain-containing sensor histidine kinase [Gemmatimonadaceae bacterium]